MKNLIMIGSVFFSTLTLANGQLCQIRASEPESSLSSYELGTLLKQGISARVFASTTKYSVYELTELAKQAKLGGREFTICIDSSKKFSVYELGQLAKSGADVVYLP